MENIRNFYNFCDVGSVVVICNDIGNKYVCQYLRISNRELNSKIFSIHEINLLYGTRRHLTDSALLQGSIHCDYVAEIVILPWDPHNPLDAAMVGTRTKIHPVHEADDGKVYIRKNASVEAVSAKYVRGS